MVGTLKRWLKKWLGLDVIEDENLRLARAILAMEKRLEEIEKLTEFYRAEWDDHEGRLVFLETKLTAKPSSPKIVPKAANWKQFRTAAEKASEPKQEQANG